MNAKESYIHALNVLKSPFPEGEKVIATSAKYSYYYAWLVLEAPFPLGEAAIANDAKYSHRYARDILKATFALNVSGESTVVEINKVECDNIIIETDDLDTSITKAVLEAIANRSEIGETPEIADKLKKAAEILKDCMENKQRRLR